MKYIHAHVKRMYWPSTIELQLFKHFRHCIRNKIFLSHIYERQTKCMNVKSFRVEIHMTHSKCTEVNLALFSQNFRSKVREDLCFCFTILCNFFLWCIRVKLTRSDCTFHILFGNVKVSISRIIVGTAAHMQNRSHNAFCTNFKCVCR